MEELSIYEFLEEWLFEDYRFKMEEKDIVIVNYHIPLQTFYRSLLSILKFYGKNPENSSITIYEDGVIKVVNDNLELLLIPSLILFDIKYNNEYSIPMNIFSYKLEKIYLSGNEEKIEFSSLNNKTKDFAKFLLEKFVERPTYIV